MSPETILAETVQLLKIARLKRRADPARIAFLEDEVQRATREVARTVPIAPPEPTRGEGRPQRWTPHVLAGLSDDTKMDIGAPGITWRGASYYGRRRAR